MKKIGKLIMLLSLLIVVGILFYNVNKEDSHYEVIEYNNFYNENNIELFYATEDKRLQLLKETYRIDEFVAGEEGELNRALRVVDIVNSIAQYDDVTDLEFSNGYDILRNRGDSKKLSGRDMALVYRELLTAIGFIARVGEFRNDNRLFSIDKNYFVVEFWSEEYSKWVMIDFYEKGYFIKDNTPLSSIDFVLEDKNNVNFVCSKEKEEYLKNKDYIFNTYSVMIDNTLDMKKSNSVITFVKGEKGVMLEHKNKYLMPTIFTENIDIFNNSPEYISGKGDSKAYIILMKKESDDNFIGGAFRDGKIMEKYYLSINDEEYTEINKYGEIAFDSGVNTIKISLDGVNMVSSIKLKKNF